MPGPTGRAWAVCWARPPVAAGAAGAAGADGAGAGAGAARPGDFGGRGGGGGRMGRLAGRIGAVGCSWARGCPRETVYLPGLVLIHRRLARTPAPLP